jgi:hypothetical protein
MPRAHDSIRPNTGDAAIITKAIGDMVRTQGMSRFSEKKALPIIQGACGPWVRYRSQGPARAWDRLVARPAAGL